MMTVPPQRSTSRRSTHAWSSAVLSLTGGPAAAFTGPRAPGQSLVHVSADRGMAVTASTILHLDRGMRLCVHRPVEVVGKRHCQHPSRDIVPRIPESKLAWT